VWVIYPHSREVIVHTPDGLARTYSGSDMLEKFDVLPRDLNVLLLSCLGKESSTAKSETKVQRLGCSWLRLWQTI
jgi:hypothetical protein